MSTQSLNPTHHPLLHGEICVLKTFHGFWGPQEFSQHNHINVTYPFEGQTAPLALPQVLVRCCLAPSWLLRRCLARDCHDKCGDSVLPINFFKLNLQTIITPNSVPGAFVVTRSLPLFQGLFCIIYDEFIPKSCGYQNTRCWLHENSHEAGHSSIGLSVMDGEKVYWFICAFVCTRNDDKKCLLLQVWCFSDTIARDGSR